MIVSLHNLCIWIESKTIKALSVGSSYLSTVYNIPESTINKCFPSIFVMLHHPHESIRATAKVLFTQESFNFSPFIDCVGYLVPPTQRRVIYETFKVDWFSAHWTESYTIDELCHWSFEWLWWRLSWSWCQNTSKGKIPIGNRLARPRDVRRNPVRIKFLGPSLHGSLISIW